MWSVRTTFVPKKLIYLLCDNVRICRIIIFRFSQMRFSAYRQYTAWIDYFEILGRCRVVIPSCAVRVIRETYPEPNGIYTGFKHFVDTF